VRTSEHRWIEQRRAEGWRIVAVELAEDAIEIPRHHACAVRHGIETDMNGGDGHGPSSDQ
jgi:hypothetical protein